MLQTIKYVTKGGSVVTHPKDLDWTTIVKNLENRKRGKGDIVVEKIKQYTIEDDPEDFVADLLDDEVLAGTVVFRSKAIIDSFKIYHGSKSRATKIPWNLPEVTKSVDWILLQNTPTQAIWSWLWKQVDNVMKLGDLHLYIYGPTESGKSTLIRFLATLGLNLYIIPKGEDFFDGIKDKKWHFAISDETRGRDQTIQFWNHWCDGFQSLKQKGKQAYLKKEIIPTILLSNYCPEKLFPKVYETSPEIMAAFKRRWLIVEVNGVIGEHVNLPV